jgi:hypothetical protein
MTAAKPKAETAEEFMDRIARHVRLMRSESLSTPFLRFDYEQARGDCRARDAARDAALLAPIRDLLRLWQNTTIDIGSEIHRERFDMLMQCATQLRACLPPEAEDSRKDES